MAMIQITGLSELAAVRGGFVDRLFTASLMQALEDCNQRPTDGSARKVTLTLHITPQADTSGLGDPKLATVTYDAEVTLKVPSARSIPFSAVVLADRGGKPIALRVNDLSLDNVRQRTLDQVESDEPPHKKD